MSNHVPSYRRHKQSGNAIVTLTDSSGNRRDVILGKFGTAASRREYARVIGEWEARGRKLRDVGAADITVTELIARFWVWVEDYYRRPDGTQTGEVGEFKHSLRPVKFLYGDLQASQFGPLAFKAVRQLMIDGYMHPKFGQQPALARTLINKRMVRVRRLFSWGVENELVPGSVCQALAEVDGLRKGRSGAKESEKVRPVARGVVEATIPLLRPMVADMVRIQLATGMRPGELVIMRAIDIDVSGQVWLYRPSMHKNTHRDLDRVIAIGPQAQEIIKRYLTTNTQAFLFSPRLNREQQDAERREKRKTPLWPSHVKAQEKKRKSRKKRWAADRYTVTSYNRAVARAIEKHNEDKPVEEHIPRWHLHQLRHLRALELKREVGLESARAVLGHQEPVITEHYAGVDVGMAMEVMGKIG